MSYYNNADRTYLFSFCTSLFFHILIFVCFYKIGLSGFSSPAHIMLKNGYSVVEFNLMPSAESKASVKKQEETNQTNIKKYPKQDNPIKQNTDTKETNTAIKTRQSSETNKPKVDINRDFKITQDRTAKLLINEIPHKTSASTCKPTRTKEVTKQENQPFKINKAKSENIKSKIPHDSSKSEKNTKNSINSAYSDGDKMIKGTVAASCAESGLYPKYPPSSRRNGEEGTVKIKAFISKDGNPVKIEVLLSSGYPKLDNSAVDAVKTAKFIPAKKNGVIIESYIDLNIKFCLKNI